jgi:hypothetical protein
MITCDLCGKRTGDGPVGDNWVCEDCQVKPEEKEESQALPDAEIAADK